MSDEYTDADVEETKSERFTRMMLRRKQAVMLRIMPISYLGNKAIYKYTREEVEEHFGEIQKALDVVKSCFVSFVGEDEDEEEEDLDR